MKKIIANAFKNANKENIRKGETCNSNQLGFWDGGMCYRVPEEIQQTIINTFNETKPAPKMKVLNYLVKNRLKNLIECTEEFYTYG